LIAVPNSITKGPDARITPPREEQTMTTKNDPRKTNSYGIDEGLARHGHVSYLEIPAVNIEESASFYEGLLGWTVQRRAPGNCSFDDGSGALIGKWVTCNAASRDPGLLPYIYVDRIDVVVERVVALGGQILKPPYAEGNLWVATFRDPAGNVMGVWQAGPR
jgi:predicted enzyme related to lactoylglutathione lyase